MAKIGKPATGGTISIPEIKVVKTTFFVMGTAPLIVHAFAEKARKEMLGKQMKEARGGRDARDPYAEVEAARYEVSEDWDGFPAVGFKAAAVTACTSVADITKVAARQAFVVKGKQVEGRGVLEGAITRNALVEIVAPPHGLREDVVRLAGPSRTAEVRYRPEYWPWAAAIDVQLNPAVLSVEQLASLIDLAGASVGVGEYRPERDGDCGTFALCSEADFLAHKDRCLAAKADASRLKKAA